MTAPTVSIVMPTFNRVHYLRPAIDSVLAQTFQDWELIIADDGSDDDTRSYLRTLEAMPRTKLVWLEHTGYPSIVRNAALRVAEGEYVAFLDSDDLWMPEKLNVQINSLRSHPAYRWSYTGFNLVDRSGNPLTARRAEPWTPHSGWIFERLLTMKLVVATPSVVANRKVILELGAFDEEQHACEDYDLWLRLAQHNEAQGLAEPLVSVRRHEEHYSADADGFIGRDRALKKLRRSCADARLKINIERERAKNAIGLSRSYVSSGYPSAAVSTLVGSLSYSWRFSQWWAGTLLTMARAIVPPKLRKTIGRYRTRIS